MQADAAIVNRANARPRMVLLGALDSFRTVLSSLWIRSLLAVAVGFQALSRETLSDKVTSWGGLLVLVIAAFFLVLGSADSYRFKRRATNADLLKLARIQETQNDLEARKVEITAELELEKLESVSLTLEITDLKKKLANLESNNAALLGKIKAIINERDAAEDRVSELSQAVTEASTRTVEALALAREAETRAATLQTVIDATAAEKRHATEESAHAKATTVHTTDDPPPPDLTTIGL